MKRVWEGDGGGEEGNRQNVVKSGRTEEESDLDEFLRLFESSDGEDGAKKDNAQDYFDVLSKRWELIAEDSGSGSESDSEKDSDENSEDEDEELVLEKQANEIRLEKERQLRQEEFVRSTVRASLIRKARMIERVRWSNPSPEKGASIQDIPDLALTNILSFLSVQDLANCSRVCCSSTLVPVLVWFHF